MSAFGAELRELRQALGLSQSALGQVLGGRSGDYVSLIERGLKPGNNIRDAVRALARTGEVRDVPRRADKTGAAVPVRAKGGGTVAPPPVAPRTTARNTYGVTRSAAPGGTQVHITGPKGGAGREKMRGAVTDTLGRFAGKRKVRIAVTVQGKDGARRTFYRGHGKGGGYKATTLARRARLTYGGDGLAMIADTFLDTEYEEAVGPGGANIVGVVLEFY